MTAAIHGSSHKALKHFRKHPSALAIYWIYVSRTNADNVAFPTIKGLAKDTGWGKTTVNKDRAWLVECKALEPVEGYIRREWRDLPPKQRAQKLNFDKSEYYRPTGYMEINGERLPMLYFGASEPSEIDQTTDVPNGGMSVVDGCPSGTDIVPRVPELNTNKDKHDSIKEPAPMAQERDTAKKARPRDPMYDAISDVWETTASGFIVSLKGMLLGTSRRGEWAKSNFDPPATPEELPGFKAYCKRINPGGNLPTTPTTIQRQFYEYRKLQARKILSIVPDSPPLDPSKLPSVDDYLPLDENGNYAGKESA